MIVSRIVGGLGNQLFQYAAGKALSHKNRTGLRLDIRDYKIYTLHDYSLKHFNIPQNFAHTFPLQRTLCKLLTGNSYFPFKVYQDKSGSFDSHFFELPNQTYLDGYWSNEKYFLSIREELLKELTLKSPLSPYSLEILDQIQKTNAVSVHIRRGDYVSNPAISEIYKICDQSYYQPAYEKMMAQVDTPHFFIFSNDIPWAKANLRFIKSATFIDNPKQQNYEDFHLMRSCKHNIIGNSTFSWWAAWLNTHLDKIVMSPAEWFLAPSHPHMPNFALDMNILPASWIRI
jgi:hypothetical protein